MSDLVLLLNDSCTEWPCAMTAAAAAEMKRPRAPAVGGIEILAKKLGYARQRAPRRRSAGSPPVVHRSTRSGPAEYPQWIRSGNGSAKYPQSAEYPQWINE